MTDLEKSPLNASVNSGKGVRTESLSHLKNQHSKGSLKAESHALISEAADSGVKHPIVLYLLALTLICMMTFGSYFIYDLPAVLDSDIKDHFAKKGKEYSDTMNLSLYSAYSYPNCVLCLIGGIIADKIGLRIATIIFLACIMTGQFLVAIGISTTSYPLMLFGRVVFGLGGESLSATQSAYCARWFKKSGVMALAFGITLSFSRVGSSVGLIVQPAASSSLGVVFAAWVGLMMCVVSFVTVVLLSILDKYGEKRGIVISVNAGEDFRLSDLKKFPGPMFILAGICVLAYCAVFPFNGIAPDFFKYKWNSGNNAATYLSVYTFVSAGGSPIIGFLVDRAGRSVSWIGGSCVGLAAVHIVLRFGPTDMSYFPVFPMVILGIALSMLGASLWPCVPYILAPNFLGTGYGLMLALQNFGLATVPLVVGIVKDHVQGMNAYYYNLYIFLGCCGGGFVLSALLFILDKKNNGLLNCDPKERERRKEEIDLLRGDPMSSPAV